MVRLCAIALTTALLFTGAQDPVGTVINVKGRWILQGTPPVQLERGSPLPSGGQVRPPQPPEPGDRLEAVFVFDGDNTRALRLSCDKPADCPESVQLPTLPSSYRLQAQVKRLREALWLLTQVNSRIVPTVARADDTLRDGVVRITSGAVDLSPVIVQLPNQRYVARFTGVTAAGDSVKPIESAAFTPARSQAVQVEGLQPGPYRLELVVSGEYTRAAETWVYAADGLRYRTAADAFAQATQAANSWSDASDARTRQAFLRAFLLSLAAEISLGR